MRRTRIMLMACLFGLAFTSPQAHQLSREHYTKIDGTENPEKIPEWHTWQSIFRLGDTLAVYRRHLDVSFPDADYEILLKEARLNPKREGKCLVSLKALPPETNIARTKSPAFVTAALACRAETLAAGHRVMAAMTPEGQAAVYALMGDIKDGMFVLVPEGEDEFFQKPR